MKRIIGISLAILLAFTAIGGLRPHDAEAREIDCSTSNLSQYDALICYFRGAISQERLKGILPNPGADPGSDAVIGHSGTLISNTGQAAGLAANAWTDRDYVQEFTTGSLTGTATWQVNSVTVFMTFNVASPTTLPTIQVQIYASNGSGKPTGSILGTFSLASTMVAGSNEFTISTPIQLDANTAYVVLVDVTATSSGGGSDVRVTYTSSDDEDSGGASGWSIGGTAFNHTWNSPNNYQGANNSQPIKIAIGGYELISASVPPTPPPEPFTQTHRQLAESHGGASITQSTTCGGKPHPVHEEFRRDPLGTDWSYADSVFCNESTGQWVTGRPYQVGVDFSRTEDLIAPGDGNYPDKCRYTNDDGDPRPGYRHNADGTVTVIHGANYDPLADVCTQRGTPLDD